MSSTIDPAYAVWLGTLATLGYDRDWVRRNSPALERLYRETAGAPMPPCPPAPEPLARDRYEDL